MEQSQRRFGRTETRLRGRRTKRLPIAAAALMTAAGAFLYFAGGHRSIDHATPSLDACRGETTSSSDCPVLNPVSEPSATSAYRADTLDSQNVEQLPNAGNRLPRRAWQQEGVASALLPGHTLAELCVVSPDAAVSHCQALTTAGLRSLTDTSDRIGEEREPSISGRVLSADGQALEGVSLVAQPERLDDLHALEPALLREPPRGGGPAAGQAPERLGDPHGRLAGLGHALRGPSGSRAGVEVCAVNGYEGSGCVRERSRSRT